VSATTLPARRPRTSPGIKRSLFFAVAFLTLAAIVGFLATGGMGSGQRATGGGEAKLAEARDASVAVGGSGTASAPESYSLDTGAAASTGGSLGDIGSIPELGAHIIKNAQIGIVVEKDFSDAFQAASSVAERYGGYVESSSSGGVKVHRGSLLIRVPSASFSSAMDDLRALGQVENESLSGQDVTAEYVDLQARLRTWEAQESALLRLMGKANSIDETLRVQRELQDVQLRIEQIRGQLRMLNDQTDLATIQVSLRERGAAVAPAPKPETERPSLAEAWTKAIDGVLGVAYVVVVGLGYLVPLTILGLVALLGWRKATRRVAPVPTVGA
jgi:hypothetical protein